MQSIEPGLRIGIVEDDARVRASLIQQIEHQAGWQLVFAVDTLAGARHADPADLVLLDLGLPDGDGIALIPDFVAQGVRVIVCTVMGDEAHVLAAIGRGAAGYLLKDAPGSEMVEAIHVVLAGGAPLTPSVAAFLLARVRRDEVRRSADDPGLAALTPREREVLLALARGYSYAETAEALGISAHTVGDHVKRIYAKLAVRSRAEAVFEAVRAGWLG